MHLQSAEDGLFSLPIQCVRAALDNLAVKALLLLTDAIASSLIAPPLQPDAQQRCSRCLQTEPKASEPLGGKQARPVPVLVAAGGSLDLGRRKRFGLCRLAVFNGGCAIAYPNVWCEGGRETARSGGSSQALNELLLFASSRYGSCLMQSRRCWVTGWRVGLSRIFR